MNNGELKMSVSPICRKDGKQLAYVSFTDEVRLAEGQIPECIITKNKGFTQDELEQLQAYMRQELDTLKKMAASVNVMGVFMGKKDV